MTRIEIAAMVLAGIRSAGAPPYLCAEAAAKQALEDADALLAAATPPEEKKPAPEEPKHEMLPLPQAGDEFEWLYNHQVLVATGDNSNDMVWNVEKGEALDSLLARYFSQSYWHAGNIRPIGAWAERLAAEGVQNA